MNEVRICCWEEIIFMVQSTSFQGGSTFCWEEMVLMAQSSLFQGGSTTNEIKTMHLVL